MEEGQGLQPFCLAEQQLPEALVQRCQGQAVDPWEAGQSVFLPPVLCECTMPTTYERMINITLLSAQEVEAWLREMTEPEEIETTALT